MGMSIDALKYVMEAHRKWRDHEPGGQCADFRGMDLSGAYIGNSDLSGADFHDSILRGAILRCSNLRDAKFGDANLSDAYIDSSDLRSADLRCNLRDADLSGADLSGADLRGADLRGARLTDAVISATTQFSPFAIVPSHGQFTAWKKVRHCDGFAILRLRVPPRAKRVSTPIGRKCRVEYCRVMAAEGIDGSPIESPSFESCTRAHPKLRYAVGDIVRASSFDDDIRSQCRPGIHCYVTRKEAIEHEPD